MPTQALHRDEATDRAELITSPSYIVDLDVTDREHFVVTTTVRFGCTRPGATSFLQLCDALEVSVDGLEGWTYRDGRIVLPGLAARNEVTVTARLPYVTDGDGMHTFTDPADGETYVSAYCGMDLAPRVFACFDQPDLKGSIALSVTAPSKWTVLANGAFASTVSGDGVNHWSFAPTPALSTYLFTMCAGPWASHEWTHHDVTFGWHARRSMAAHLEREAGFLEEVTTACFDHYLGLFDEPYAFDSYDQVLVPELNWGAIEFPGCVVFRDELLPSGAMSQGERDLLTEVIAHEMAHMWFGDLATLTWWEDAWLIESFADYLGFRVAGEACRVRDVWAGFEVGYKSPAYLADERRSTHPVAPRAEDVPDARTALGNFDSITYAKGNAVLRQLATWLGDHDFFAGVNRYLTAHRFANATLDDFIDALDAVTDQDVRAWAAAWLRTSGFDTLTVTRVDGVPVLSSTGGRTHRVSVAAIAATGGVRVDEVVLGSSVALEWASDHVVVPNCDGASFARIRLDPSSWAWVREHLSSLDSGETRAVLWSLALDLVATGELAVPEYLDLLERHLPGESSPGVVEELWGRTTSWVVPVLVRAADVRAARTRLAALAETMLADSPGVLGARLARVVAATSGDAGLLRSRLAADDLDPRLRWTLVHRLAALGELTEGDLESYRRADPTSVGALGARRAVAALPSPAAKEAAFALLLDRSLSNRETEAVAEGLWEPEQAALVAPYVARYVEAVRTIARDDVAFAERLAGLFPRLALRSCDLDLVQAALDAGDLPVGVARAWSDALDDARLATAARW